MGNGKREAEHLYGYEAVVLIKTSCVYVNACPQVIYLYEM